MPRDISGVVEEHHRLAAGRLMLSARYASWLRSLGLQTLQSFLQLNGEIISGHPRRHVMRVRILGETCFLKKEHQVNRSDRLKNAIAGFGFVSSSWREAMMLSSLAAAGVPCPEWMATGETPNGRAFLLLRGLVQRVSLRDLLESGGVATQLGRRSLCCQLAHVVAMIHSLGITYPDLVAKHILLSLNGDLPAFVDWQRGRRAQHLSWRERASNLASLHASIRPEVLTPFDRWRFLVGYGRAAGLHRSLLRRMVPLILRKARQLERKSSFREQRLPGIRRSQSLFWQDGDRLCLSELGRQLVPCEVLSEWAYPEDNAGPQRAPHQETPHAVVLPSGAKAQLIRRRTRLTLWQRMQRFVRGRVYLAPECREAARLLRSERQGDPRCLLAFGQWERTASIVDSFLLRLAGDGDLSWRQGGDDCRV